VRDIKPNVHPMKLAFPQIKWKNGVQGDKNKSDASLMLKITVITSS